MSGGQRARKGFLKEIRPALALEDGKEWRQEDTKR